MSDTRVMEPDLGSGIHDAIRDAIVEAATHNSLVRFRFNGVTVVVGKWSNADLIYRDWERGIKGCLGDNPAVRPYPRVELSVEERASDALVEAENERRRDLRTAEYSRQQAAALTTLRDALSTAGPLELAGSDAWDTHAEANRDGYGGRVMQYAEDWGRLMQARIANGETVAGCAAELSHLADHDGITGFMHGIATATLSKCWKHGDELWKWHQGESE